MSKFIAREIQQYAEASATCMLINFFCLYFGHLGNNNLTGCIPDQIDQETIQDLCSPCNVGDVGTSGYLDLRKYFNTFICEIKCFDK